MKIKPPKYQDEKISLDHIVYKRHTGDTKIILSSITAEVLTDVDLFGQLFAELRKKHNLQLVSYPEDPDLNMLMDLIQQQEVSSAVMRDLGELLEGLQLGQEWKLPFIVLSITGVLPIPMVDQGIRIGKRIYDLTEQDPHLFQVPVIAITKRMTVGGLRKILSDPYYENLITELTKDLPKEPRMKDENISLGRFAWLLKEEGLSFARMPKRYDQLMTEEAHASFFKKKTRGQLSADDFKNAYTVYLKKVRVYREKLGKIFAKLIT